MRRSSACPHYIGEATDTITGGAYDREMVLRCTKKLLAVIGPIRFTDPAPSPTPNDEEWHANLLWCEERKCLPLTHAGTLFTIFKADVRVADLRTTDSFVSGLIRCELIDEVLRSTSSAICTPRSSWWRKRVAAASSAARMTWRSIAQLHDGGLEHGTSWHSIGPWVAISTVPATTNDRST